MKSEAKDRKVSVIVPVYMAGRWLRRCAASILHQTHRNLELIMVDDGSPDDSGMRADAYTIADPRAKALHIEHGGVSVARNAGLAEATGDYVLFVDADDELHPQAIETMVNAALRTGADIISTPIRAGGSAVFREISTTDSPVSYFQPEEAAELHLYRRKLDCSICGKLFERRLFTDNYIRFPKGLRYEDIAMSHLVYTHCRGVAHLDEKLYFYRAHSNGFLRVWSPERRDCFAVVGKILEDTKDNPRLYRAAEDRMFFISYNIYLLAWLHGEKDTAMKCWDGVKKYRLRTLFSRRTVFYNRWRALASYFGPKYSARLTRYRY
ncbi:MAG: glycosyltransferase [Muribaculaceae bacterium]|nr:glycosyltransferase [Muribaculaceae bacterium]